MVREIETTEGARQLRAVAVGGGSGIPSTLNALLDLGCETSAVVAMSDNGGSTGELRDKIGIVPPGDIRNCLVAMASDRYSTIAQAFQYRLPLSEDGPRHALGNLTLAALADITGSFPEAIALVEDLLQCRGHVYPSTLDNVDLVGEDRNGKTHQGQVAVCRSEVAIARVWFEPSPAHGFEPALEALRRADLIVLGPGSLYTSIIPNVIVDGFAEAIRESDALVVYICNLSNQQGETRGLRASGYLEALHAHGLAGAIDVMLVHEKSDLCTEKPSAASLDETQSFVPVSASGVVQRVISDDFEQDKIRAHGVAVVTADLASSRAPARHSRRRLTGAIEKVLDQCPIPPK